MRVSLTEQLEAFVREKVESGRYNNASEVIREALRLLEQHDEVHRLKIERLREAVYAAASPRCLIRFVPLLAPTDSTLIVGFEQALLRPLGHGAGPRSPRATPSRVLTR